MVMAREHLDVGKYKIPAWMTPLLRALMEVPMASAASRMVTLRPLIASARATARPTTPAPMEAGSHVSEGQVGNFISTVLAACQAPPHLRL